MTILLYLIAAALILAGLPMPRGNRKFREFWACERGDIGSIIGIGSSLIGGIMGNNAADAQASAASNAALIQKLMYG